MVNRMHLGIAFAGAQGEDFFFFFFVEGLMRSALRRLGRKKGERHTSCQRGLGVSVIFGADCKWCYSNC